MSNNTIIVEIGGNNTVIVQATTVATVEIEVPGPIGPAGTNRADIPFNYTGLGLSTDYDNPLGTVVTKPITLVQADSYAVAKAGASVAQTFILQRTRNDVTVQIGTVAFGINQKIGVVTLTATDLIAHDIFECVGPAIPDAALSDVKITIAGTRA